MTQQHCGRIAFVGRPNVGKSTLLNRLLGAKLCITSSKPQTTRHAILGIQTRDHCQSIYVDTPGLHDSKGQLIHRMMNQTAKSVLNGVDVVGFVVEAGRFGPADRYVLDCLIEYHVPCVLIVNKVDRLKVKDELLPFLQDMQSQHAFEAIVPISAKTGEQVTRLQQCMEALLPAQPWVYPPDQWTTCSTRFLCAELLREKIFRLCGQELPYAVTVEIEAYEEGEHLDRIFALIVVEKESHKRMVIGEGGQKLKRIASEARVEMERLIDKKVFLKCFCQVKSGWADNQRLLKQFGYEVI